MKMCKVFMAILVVLLSNQLFGQKMYSEKLEELKKQPSSAKRDSAIIYYMFSLSKLRNPGIAWNDSIHKFSVENKSKVGYMLWKLKDIECDITNLNYEQGIRGILTIANDLEKLNYKSYAAFAYLRAGILYVYSTDDFLDRKNAIPYYSKAIQLSSEANDKTEMLRANDYMGELYFEMNDFEKAIFYLKKAEKLVEENDDKYMYPSIAVSLSASYFQIGELSTSDYYYRKMDYWLNKSDLKFDNLYHVYINYLYQKGVASRYLYLKQYDKATFYALQGLNAIKEGLAGRKKRTGKFENYTMNLLRILYLANSQQNKYKEAFIYLQELHEKQTIHQKSELNSLFQDLNLKYQTEQNKLKITALENENLKKDADKQSTLKYFGTALISLLLIIIGSIFYSNRKLKIKNKEISEAMLKGQTIERQRVALDLHDNLGSTLSALWLNIDMIDKSRMNAEEIDIHQNLKVNLEKAYNDVRLLSHNLLPEEFEKQGLVPTLQGFVRKISKNSNIRFDLQIAEGFGRVDNKIEFELYSICLELVNNIIKHSKATESKISLSRTEKKILLIISDNGIGTFNNDSDGKGMKNVKARVGSLNGIWNLQNAENQGFTSSFSVPY